MLDMGMKKITKAVVATQGDVGLRLAEEMNPTAIIMDMQLPGMDGWSVLKKFVKTKKKHIPIHIMSAMDRQKLGLEMGCDCLPQKSHWIKKKDLDRAFTDIDKEIAEGNRKVLIVEDTAIQQDIVQNLLLSKISKQNFSLQLLQHRQQQLLKEDTFDCIILDLDLGKESRMKESDCLKKLRQIP